MRGEGERRGGKEKTRTRRLSVGDRISLLSLLRKKSSEHEDRMHMQHHQMMIGLDWNINLLGSSKQREA